MDIAQKNGVLIESGADNNQVFQQENGKATITLSGSWILDPNDPNENFQVFVQVKNEETNLPVTDTLKAEIIPGKKWKIDIENVPVGGPYRIETCLRERNATFPLMWTTRGDQRHNIYVGDVYLIMGQSNSVGYAKDFCTDTKQPGVQMFRDSGCWDLASHPLHDSTDTVFDIYRDGGNTGHSPYISFGKKILRKTGTPVGLIMISKGGAPMDLFFPDRENLFYDAMKLMLSRAGVKKPRAVFWHQGCTDAEEERPNYKEGLAKIIKATRKDFGDEKLPWFILQISRFGGFVTDHDKAWGAVKQAQADLADEMNDVYILSTLDCITSDDVHNNTYSSIMLGERLAGYVLKYLDGFKTEYVCPEFLDAKFEDDGKSVRIKFRNVIESISNVQNVDMPFTVSDKDGNDIKLTSWEGYGDCVVLHAENEIPADARVGACWQTHVTFKPPFDTGTRLPIVAFYNKEINK